MIAHKEEVIGDKIAAFIQVFPAHLLVAAEIIEQLLRRGLDYRRGGRLSPSLWAKPMAQPRCRACCRENLEKTASRHPKVLGTAPDVLVGTRLQIVFFADKPFVLHGRNPPWLVNFYSTSYINLG